MPHFIVTGKDHDTGLVGTLACDAESQAAAASLAAGKGLIPLSIIAADAAAGSPHVAPDAVATGVVRGAGRLIGIVVCYFFMLDTIILLVVGILGLIMVIGGEAPSDGGLRLGLCLGMTVVGALGTWWLSNIANGLMGRQKKAKTT